MRILYAIAAITLLYGAPALAYAPIPRNATPRNTIKHGNFKRNGIPRNATPRNTVKHGDFRRNATPRNTVKKEESK